MGSTARGQGRPFTPPRGRAMEGDDRARRAFGIRSVRIGAHDHPVCERVPLALPFADLRVFSREGNGRTVLVVPPLAGGFPFLVRDFVIEMLRHATRVAVAEWLDPRFVPAAEGGFGFDDNLAYVEEMVRALGEGVHVVGICQGAVPALAATALLSEGVPATPPLSLVLIGGPVDPLANPTRAVQLARSRPLSWFDEHVIQPVPEGFPGAGRLVYPRLLQYQTLMGYIGRHYMEHRELFWKFATDDGEDPFTFPFSLLALTLMDLARDFFLGNIRLVFQERALCTGRMTLGDRPVDPQSLVRTALMTIEGADDDLCAPGQTRAAHDLCTGLPQDRRRHLVVPGSGHFSLFHGRLSRQVVAPAIVEFWTAAEASGTVRRVRRKPRVA